MIPKDKKIIVMGTGGSGKTYYTLNKLWKDFKCPLAYDINGDFAKAKGGVSYIPDDVTGEFMKFLNTYFEMTKKKKIDAIFFDDADAYIDYEMMNNPKFKDLVIRQRNWYKVSLVFITKRPQNLPTKIVENAHILIIHQIEGKNALQRLTDIDQRIIPLLDEVNKKPHSHVYKEEGQAPIWKPATK